MNRFSHYLNSLFALAVLPAMAEHAPLETLLVIRRKAQGYYRQSTALAFVDWHGGGLGNYCLGLEFQFCTNGILLTDWAAWPVMPCRPCSPQA
ncbi:MAG: hypothetical protein ACI9BO_001542 [Zhongshania sp.]|jgi:hypothetical protein